MRYPWFSLMKPGVVDPSLAMTGSTLITGGTKSVTALAVWVLVLAAVNTAPESTTPPTDAAESTAITTRAKRPRFTPPPPGLRAGEPLRRPGARRARSLAARSGWPGTRAARSGASARRAPRVRTPRTGYGRPRALGRADPA